MSGLVDALAITPGQAPGASVVHVVSRCHVMLVCEAIAVVALADAQADQHADLAKAHLSSCPCGSVTLMIHDGDSGQLVYAEVISHD